MFGPDSAAFYPGRGMWVSVWVNLSVHSNGFREWPGVGNVVCSGSVGGAFNPGPVALHNLPVTPICLLVQDLWKVI